MCKNKVRAAGILCAALVLQGCATETARYTTESGTWIAPEVLQAHVKGHNIEPFLPYRAASFESNRKGLDQRRATYGIPSVDTVTQQVMSHWYTEQPSEIVAVRFEPVVRSKTHAPLFTFVNILVSGATMYLVPARISADMTGSMTLVMSDGSEIRQEATFKSVRVYSAMPQVFGLDYNISTNSGYEWQVASLISQGEKLRQVIAREQKLLQDLDRQSVEALTAALRNPDIVLLKQDIMVSLGNALATRPDRLDHYQKLTREFPVFHRYIPGHDKLFFVGPADRQVLDVWRELRSGADPNIVAATIRAAGRPYRIYTGDETVWLKKQSIPDPVIIAMIEASASTNSAAGATHVSVPGAGQSLQQIHLQSGPAAAGGAESNLLAECAKAIAAIKACEQIKGDKLGVSRTICVNQVKKGLGGTDCFGL